MNSRFLENALFALRNIFRQRARAVANLLAIALGVAGLIVVGGFVQDIFVQLGEAIIHGQTGHVQISKEGFQRVGLRSPEKYLIEKPELIRGQLKAIPGTSAVLSRINFTGTLNNGKRDLGVLGEYLADLPYKSDVLNLDEETWKSWDGLSQEKFIRTLSSKLRHYQKYNADVDRWVELAKGSDPRDRVYPIPLEMMP